MTISTKKLTFLVTILALIGAIGSFISIVTFFKVFQKQENPLVIKLEQQEMKIWQQLEKQGVSHSDCRQLAEKYRLMYQKETPPKATDKLSPKIKELIHTVCQDFEIDSSSFVIVPYRDQSPAAANETMLFVNQKEFNRLTPAAQRFVIGHELHHIMHHDDAFESALHQLAEKQKIDESKLDSPVNHYLRFREERADIETASKDAEYARGFQEFMQHIVRTDGENPGITHPKNSLRLLYAKDMVHLAPPLQKA